MNDCKLLIDEAIITNKKNIRINNQELELVNKYNILLNNSKNKIVVSNLDIETNNKINLLFNTWNLTHKSIWNCSSKFKKKIHNQQDIFNNSLVKSLKFANDYDNNNELLESDDNFIINLAYKHLINSGFSVGREGLIEYWSFNLDNNINNSIVFDVYKDNELLDFNVETCIFFTQNDESIIGNLDYYKISHGSPKSPTTNFYYGLKESNEFNTNITQKEIKITSNLIIMVSGNQLYCPQPLYGNGIRNYIIVRFRSNYF